MTPQPISHPLSGGTARRLRRSRGTILAVFSILLPMAAGLLLLNLTRLDGALRETSRHQARVQARLLAESALAVLRAASPSPGQAGLSSIRGEIAGIGTFETSLDRLPETGDAIVIARGVAASPLGGEGTHGAVAEIRAELREPSSGPGDGLRVIGLDFRWGALAGEP